MFLISSWSLFQVQSYLPLSIINYCISKHYAGAQVSDRRPLGYLFNAVKAKVIILTWYVKSKETMAIYKFQRSRLTFALSAKVAHIVVPSIY